MGVGVAVLTRTTALSAPRPPPCWNVIGTRYERGPFHHRHPVGQQAGHNRTQEEAQREVSGAGVAAAMMEVKCRVVLVDRVPAEQTEPLVSRHAGRAEEPRLLRGGADEAGRPPDRVSPRLSARSPRRRRARPGPATRRRQRHGSRRLRTLGGGTAAGDRSPWRGAGSDARGKQLAGGALRNNSTPTTSWSPSGPHSSPHAKSARIPNCQYRAFLAREPHCTLEAYSTVQ